MGDAGSRRITEARAEAAVGTGIHPAAGLVRVDELAGVGDEVAAVTDHDRVAIEARDQLAVDARRVNRIAIAGQLGALGLTPRSLLIAQAGDPVLVIGALAAVL